MHGEWVCDLLCTALFVAVLLGLFVLLGAVLLLYSCCVEGCYVGRPYHDFSAITPDGFAYDRKTDRGSGACGPWHAVSHKNVVIIVFTLRADVSFKSSAQMIERF